MIQTDQEILFTLPGRGCTVVGEVRSGNAPYVNVLVVGREVVERRYLSGESEARAVAATMVFEHERRTGVA